MQNKLSVVVNNPPANQEPTAAYFAGDSDRRVTKARSLLIQASSLLGGLGTQFRDVQSLIDECDLMLRRESCEPFANLAK